MKQIIQSFKTGETKLEQVPAPRAKRGQVLIRTTRSLVSLGTERMLVEFGQASLIQKARQQPDKVKMVLDKVKTDGLLPTMDAVFNKLEQPLPLGYCNVGRVIEVGEGVNQFKVGDRVASNGHHAEFVCVPQNLVAHIPDAVSDEAATFTVIGSIGLQGIRLLDPTLGETVVVIGLGLIGLLTAELLLANGCQVIGVDLDDHKLDIARAKGVQVVNPRTGTDPVRYVQDFTGGTGADGVIITASAKTDDIISQAARMSRKRGKIVLVGVIGLHLSRAEFYEKELTFQVSCSYGPGRYDDNYEARGQDYPLPYVRWTEKRNFETVLAALETGRLDVEPLITEVTDLDDFGAVYGNISQSTAIASILAYPADAEPTPTVEVAPPGTFAGGSGVLGVVGSGNYAKMTLLPALKGAPIKYIASAGGVSGTALAQKHGIAKSTTDYREMLRDPEVNTVLITTRHNLHAPMVIETLEAGKNVFVEKPLALSEAELQRIIAAEQRSTGTVNVGFNRRFSPHAQRVKALLDPGAPKNLIATMNAGFIPADVWVHDLRVGGGRIVGEACHFIDLLAFFSGSPVAAVCASALGQNPEQHTDNASILLKFTNGDQGVINYFANGSKSYAKERLEIYSQEKTIVTDNWRVTRGYGTPKFTKLKTKLDKGHAAQFRLLAERARSGGAPLIPFAELINTTRASFAALRSLREGTWVTL